MLTAPENNPIEMVVKTIKKIIEQNKFEAAFELLDKYISPISDSLSTSIILKRAGFARLENRKNNGDIRPDDIDFEENRLMVQLLGIIKTVPQELDTQRILGKYRKSIYATTDEPALEKILGPQSNLLKINWLEKGLRASRSVCKVLRSDGGSGTGFLLKNGYLLTNFHVLPNADQAAKAKLIFDYEEDLGGGMQKTSEFLLDAADAKFSPVKELDYAFIKVIDNPASPLGQWGFLEVDTFTEPQPDSPVTIIQHPLGQTKQIALTANKVIATNGNRLLYQTDTERGSSGSPVFDANWKVVALHHAGKTEEEGGMPINAAGERRGANEGILIKEIAKHIGRDI